MEIQTETLSRFNKHKLFPQFNRVLKGELTIAEFGKLCEKHLIDNGYIYSQLVGFQKKESFERAEISPETRGVPVEWSDNIEVVERMVQDKFGNKKKGKETKQGGQWVICQKFKNEFWNKKHYEVKKEYTLDEIVDSLGVQGNIPF